jgi:AcrR family transcriptional regulator
MARGTTKAFASRPAAGRPRDADRHQAVLDATRELLREQGYSLLSIDAIARRAGVSRPLLYRWWGHKARIVEEVLFRVPATTAVPDTGSLEGDLRALVEETAENYARREMVLGLPGLQADIVADPGLIEETEARYTRGHFQRWREVLERAAARGEIGPDENARAVFHAAVGAITVLVQQRTFRRRETADFVTRLVLHGIQS